MSEWADEASLLPKVDFALIFCLTHVRMLPAAVPVYFFAYSFRCVWVFWGVFVCACWREMKLAVLLF